MGSVGVAPRRRATGRRRKPGASRPLWLEIAALLVLAFLVALLVRTFLLGVYYIPSGSMENTLRIGDRVVVDKLSYRFDDVSRGDIVVFNGAGSFTAEGEDTGGPSGPVARAADAIRGVVGAPSVGERDFIKRVIGVAGDRVVCCDEQGRVTINGIPLDEPYLYPGDQPSEEEFDVVVPPGKVWVLGDHRSASADSRAHLGDPGGGMVPVDRIIGRARAVVWPWSAFGGLGRPDSFDESFG